MTLKNTPTILFALLVAVIVFAVTALVVTQTRGDAPASETDPGALGGARGAESTISRAQAALADDPAFVAALSALAEASLVRARETGDPSLAHAGRGAPRGGRWPPTRRRVRGDRRARHPRRSRAIASRRRSAWTRRSLAVAPRPRRAASASAPTPRSSSAATAGLRRRERRLEPAPRPRLVQPRLVRRGARGRPRLRDPADAPGGPAAAALGSTDRATARTQLGLVLLAQGDVDAAEREMRGALAEKPDSTNAMFGLGRVLAARGELAEAASLFAEVAVALPEPDHLAALAEVELRAGPHGRRPEHIATRCGRPSTASPRTARTWTSTGALLEADFRRPTAADIAMRPARAGGATGHRRRPGARLGAHARRPMRGGRPPRDAAACGSGTRDPFLLFHAGMAAACAGDAGVARSRLSAALELNPAFSVRWAPGGAAGARPAHLRRARAAAARGAPGETRAGRGAIHRTCPRLARRAGAAMPEAPTDRPSARTPRHSCSYEPRGRRGMPPPPS